MPFLVATVLLFSCNNTQPKDSLPFFNQPDFTPEWIAQSAPAFNHIHQIPAFAFANQDGAMVTEKTVANKIYVANFFFTICGSICPRMMNNLKMVADKYKDDPNILLLSHSVMPEKDSVVTLKNYAIARGIPSLKWHLLTGDKKVIYAIAKREYFAGEAIGYYGQQSDFLHTENCLLIDTKRRIRGVYNATLPLEMERMMADIDILKKE